MPGAGWVVTTGSTAMEWPSTWASSSATTFTINQQTYQRAYQYWVNAFGYNFTTTVEQVTADLRRLARRAEQSEEERAAQAEERERETQDRRRRWEAARDRARQTLLTILDEDGRQRYLREGIILVTGSAGGWYRIRQGYQGNVDLLNEYGRAIQRYCAHPRMTPQGLGGDRMPDEDAMITQMLKLQTDEPGFLEIANVV